jgi:cation transport regulator ChaC
MALYFAYGSCMSPKDFARTSKGKMIGSATLFDYRLGFTRYSKNRQGGVADIVPSGGDYVEGILWEVPSLKPIDKREGHPHIYRRVRVKVFIPSLERFVYATTYEVLEKGILDPREYAPSKQYANLILEGAKFLSEDYRDLLTTRYMNFE